MQNYKIKYTALYVFWKTKDKNDIYVIKLNTESIWFSHHQIKSLHTMSFINVTKSI